MNNEGFLSLMKTWYGIDLFKLLAALLIVYLHTYNSDWGVAGAWVKQVLCTSCVPFFFISSGFLFRKGLERSRGRNGSLGEKEWFSHYFTRLLKLYLVWTLLSLPIAFLIVNRGHPDYGAAMKTLYLFRLFLLTGSIGYYWYILALIMSVVVVYWFYRKGLLAPLLISAVILFLWGCLYNSRFNHHQPWFEILHVVFGSERNFLNVGLFYLLIGFLFPEQLFINLSGLRKWLPLVVGIFVLALRTIEVRFLKTNFTQAFVAVGAFIIALSFSYAKLNKVSLELRKLSVGLYMLHCPFILSFDFYLRRGTLLDFPVTLAFCLVVYLLISWYAPKLSSLLFGYPGHMKPDRGNKTRDNRTDKTD